jgi:signal transduction histidine kinase
MRTKSQSNRAVQLAFGSAIAILLVVGAFSYRTIVLSNDRDKWLEHTHEVLSNLQELLTSMQTITSSGRGFVITGEESNLVPYRAAISSMEQHQAAIRKLTVDNPVQQRELPILERLEGERVQHANMVINLRRTKGIDAVEDAVRSGASQQTTNEFQVIVTQMQDEELRLLALRNADVKRSFRETRAILLFGTILGLLITSVAGWSVQRFNSRRALDEQALLEEKERAEVANRAKSFFLANMSHELRTPLNAIIGFSQIIKDETMGPGRPIYANYAKDICGAGEHLLEIINNLLDLSKIEAGKTELNEELSDPSEIVGASLSAMRVQAASKKIALTANIPLGTPFIRGDALRLRQVLINLVSNAVKFTEAGHVTVSVACDAAQGFRFTVADTGIGMSPVEIKKALEPFGQVEHAITKKYEGTGLGLPLAQRLVELHGGHLVIDSVKGVGTTVSVHLPLERVVQSVLVAA